MSKEEFLEGLRKTLSSSLSSDKIRENILFYSSYIDEEIKKGRTEKEVLEELGDPRLIANSIKEANGVSDDIFFEEKSENFRKENKQTYTDDYGNDIHKDLKYKFFNLSGFSLILFLLLALFIVLAIASLFLNILGFLLKLLAPIIGPLVLILVIIIFIQIYKKNK